MLDIEFEDWLPNQIRIWLNGRNAQKWNIFHTRSPTLPSFSLISFELTLEDCNKQNEQEKIQDSAL